MYIYIVILGSTTYLWQI